MAANPEVGEDFQRAIAPVAEWAAEVTGLPVVHDWTAPEDGAAVVLYPLDLELPAVPAAVVPRSRSAELSVRLLVSVVGASVLEAAAAASGLALEAAIEGEWRMESGRPDLELWEALGRPPVPAFVLVVPVRRIAHQQPVPVVRRRLQVIPARIRTVTGRVVAPTGEPLPAARVALTDGNASGVTDHRGRFRLDVATIEGEPLRLTLSARGASAAVDIDDPPVEAGGDLGDLVVPVPSTAATTR